MRYGAHGVGRMSGCLTRRLQTFTSQSPLRFQRHYVFFYLTLLLFFFLVLPLFQFNSTKINLQQQRMVGSLGFVVDFVGSMLY